METIKHDKLTHSPHKHGVELITCHLLPCGILTEPLTKSKQTRHLVCRREKRRIKVDYSKDQSQSATAAAFSFT